MTADFTAKPAAPFIARVWTAIPIALLDTDGEIILDTDDGWLNPTNHPKGVPVLAAGVSAFAARSVTFEAAGPATFKALPDEE